MAIIPKEIPAGSQQTITISGASTYDFHGLTLENVSSLAAETTITILNSDDVTLYPAVYAKAFPDDWVPGSVGETPWKRVSPSDGPIKITLSGTVTGYANIYYQKRT